MATVALFNEEKSPEKAFISKWDSLQEQTYEVQNILTIGRSMQNQFCLEDPSCSHRHARIEYRNNAYILKDLRSRNGTYLNGSRVLEAPLKNRDRIVVGQTEFLFSFERDFKEVRLALKSKNKSWSKQLDSLPQIANSELPALIMGASGTGKEVLARTLHQLSTRSLGPFVSVNCGALSSNLIESELFGHVKGSYTGATADRKGAFESARGGSLFLDEIGDLPIDLQPKLLRALENCEIRPVGSDKNILTNVRIIAATHNTLKQKVANKEFREDLFYRLQVLTVQPPQLTERLEDFEDLLYFFAKQSRVRFNFKTVQGLKEHHWPGNIRELKNAIARASALYGKSEVLPQHITEIIDQLPELTNTDPNAIQSIAQIEKKMICKALIKCHGNQRKASALLDLPKSTLHDRIRKYRINVQKLIE